MKAAILERFDAPLTLANIDDPACPRDGVVIALKACGICRSDHHAWKGLDPAVTLPHVMGHELAGVVVETGPDCKHFRAGDRVTVPFVLGCGTCADCAAGEPTICDDQAVIGFTRPGAFSEFVAIERADFNLVRLPDSIAFTHAAGMGCRVTTAWRALSGRARLQPGEWLAVHGCGGVGLSAILVAKALGAHVVGIDVNADALAMARALGADMVLDASAFEDVGEAVREATNGGTHVAMDALGVTATFDNSLRSLRKLGRHLQIGKPLGRHATVDLPLLELVYSRQLAIVGSRGMGAAGFGPLLDLVETGKLDIAQLVTAQVPLSKAGDVLKAMDGYSAAGVTVIDRFDS